MILTHERWGSARWEYVRWRKFDKDPSIYTMQSSPPSTERHARSATNAMQLLRVKANMFMFELSVLPLTLSLDKWGDTILIPIKVESIDATPQHRVLGLRSSLPLHRVPTLQSPLSNLHPTSKFAWGDAQEDQLFSDGDFPAIKFSSIEFLRKR